MDNTEDSLLKKYLVKISSNLVGMIAGVITTIIAPNILGPNQYGIFGFISDFFIKLFGLADSDTSTAFYTKLSQRQKDFSLIDFYWLFCIFISVVILLGIIISVSLGASEYFWPKTPVKFIYFGFLYGLLSWMVKISTKTLDALGLTVHCGKIRFTVSIFKVFLILILALTNQLSLTSFFIFHILLLLSFIIGYIIILKSKNIPQLKRLSRRHICLYVKEMHEYASPLITFSIIGFILGISQRWLLQHFGGSSEQGYYTLAYQLGTICFLFSGSMTPLFHRELTIAYTNKNFEDVKFITEKFLPLFFYIVSFISLFGFFYTKEILTLLYGNKFLESIWTIKLMMLYPIHQTYGQLIASIYFASENTKNYRNIGTILAIISTVATFFLIAPDKYFGLNLKSEGLSLQMVFMQLFGIHIFLAFVPKQYNLDKGKIVLNEFIILILFGLASITSKKSLDLLEIDSLTAQIVTGFLIYFTASATLTLFAIALKIPVLLHYPRIISEKYLKKLF
jgi:O-antigen/teichoic acid export membrane protein